MDRPYFRKKINEYFHNHSVVALLGPRQCGKTTLAKLYIEQKGNFPPENYFDLEDDVDLARLTESQTALASLQGLIVIDEIQRLPHLFRTLRVLVDKNDKQKFLILGSASRDLIQQSSETLAGRIAYLELTPFSFFEVKEIESLWLRGGFPKSFLAETAQDSWNWRSFYISTFLERDIPSLGIKIPSYTLRRFWTMIAHYHANICNYSELSRSFGVTDMTIRHYLDILSGTFMVRQLQPWHENLKKRQVKAPKIYIRDSGLLHSLLDIADKSSLLKNPKLGASWEGFALEEIIMCEHAEPHECFFWSTHGGAELDLLILKNNKRLGFEFKFQDAPTRTKSMQVSLQDLQLDSLTVIYPGNRSYSLAEKIKVVGLYEYLMNLKI